MLTHVWQRADTTPRTVRLRGHSATAQTDEGIKENVRGSQTKPLSITFLILNIFAKRVFDNCKFHSCHNLNVCAHQIDSLMS